MGIASLFKKKQPKISMPYNVKARAGSWEIGTFKDTEAFENHQPQDVATDVLNAKSLNAKPATAGTKEFDDLIHSHIPFKWVLTIFGKLNVIPAVNDNIKHPAACMGEHVFAAGSGGWNLNVHSGKVVLVIDNWTGHYKASEHSVKHRGLLAWQKAGYQPEYYDKAIHSRLTGIDAEKADELTLAYVKKHKIKGWQP